MMQVQIAKWGNSLALRIPSAIAKAISVEEGGPVTLTIEGGRLVVAPVEEMPTYELSDLLEGMTEENLHEPVETGPAVGDEFA